MAAAFGWISIIVLAVVALGALLVNVAKDVYANSPEGKLKAAQEEADKAAEAADRLTESYNNLNNAIDSLEDKYETIKGLTRGTEEWRNAV
jgi:hypothetical protein